MSGIVFVLLLTAIFVVVIILVDKKPKGIMQEGKLMKSEMVYKDGEKFYVEKVICKDWHAGIHSYYLIYDRLVEGQNIVEQRWSYEDFCNVSFRLEDCTYLLIRQIEVVALVRSFRPIPIDEFDRIAMPLVM